MLTNILRALVKNSKDKIIYKLKLVNISHIYIWPKSYLTLETINKINNYVSLRKKILCAQKYKV